MTTPTPIEQPDKELEKQLIFIIDPIGDLDPPYAKRTVKKIMSLIESHTNKAETHLVARLQAEVISPHIDEMFGTIDYKGVASKLLEFVEAELEKETP